MSKYQVVDNKTGRSVGKPHVSRQSARRKADKLDNEYGAYRYGVRMVEIAEENK